MQIFVSVCTKFYVKTFFFLYNNHLVLKYIFHEIVFNITKINKKFNIDFNSDNYIPNIGLLVGI